MTMHMFPCPHCPADFDSLRSLEYHLRAMHSAAMPSAPYRCVTCDAEFMAQAEWLDHMHDDHEPERLETGT